MKSVLSTVVLVIAIISVSSGFNNKCVRENDGASFKHPESDQLYFVCFNGETFEVKCRENYYYSEENSKCVLSIDAPGENPPTFNACANVEGVALIPSETSCRHFYFCIYGVLTDAVCPANQLFDPILLGCYDAEVVNCNPWTTTISTTLVETTSTTEIFTTTTEMETTTTEATNTEDATTEDSTIENTTIVDTTTEGTTTTETTTNDQTPEISMTTTTIFETTELTEEITQEISTVTTEQTTIGTTTDYPTTVPTTTTTNSESNTPTEGTTIIDTTTSEETTEIFVTSTTGSEATEVTEEITPEMSTVTTEQTTIGTTTDYPTTVPTTTTTNSESNTPTEGTTIIDTTTSEETTEIFVTSTTGSEATEVTEEITPEMSTVTTEQTTIGTTTDYSTTPPSETTTNPESVCHQIPDSHLVNNPASCDAFFVCFYEIPISGICPAPLLFNPSKSECDDPENVICYDATEPTTEAPNICDGVPNGELVDNPESCPHFFICINNVPQPGVCPLGLYFNNESRSCDPSENVNCFPPTIPTEIPTVPSTEAPTTTEEPPSDACVGINDGTLVNNPRYCDAFFLCFGENAIKGTCQPPSLFNSILGICDLPKNVICDIETTTTMIETTTEAVDICYGFSDFTFLNDPRKCTDYFICYNGQSLPQSCPDGFYFDPSIFICARSETVHCDDNESTTAEVSSTTEEAITTEKSTTTEEPTTTTEEPTTTTEEPTTTTEEPTTTTEEATTTTEEPTITTEEPTTTTEEPTTTMEESTTPDRTTTTEETSTAQPIPENCPSTGVQAIPNPDRCSRFRLCASGLEFELVCPPDEHFVFARAQCLPREIANCTIPIPVCDPIASAQHVLTLHHPHYCDRFFLCFIGTLTPLNCAEGQHFDMVSQQCTSIAIANCEL